MYPCLLDTYPAFLDKPSPFLKTSLSFLDFLDTYAPLLNISSLDPFFFMINLNLDEGTSNAPLPISS
jgi:hypothetical protein